jgi:transcriptional regulator with XRE-family HTH domain
MRKKRTQPLDAVMETVQALRKKSGLSLQKLGEEMGYDADIARQSAFQFLHAKDPHISMLRRFAKAVGVPLKKLIDEPTASR